MARTSVLYVWSGDVVHYLVVRFRVATRDDATGDTVGFKPLDSFLGLSPMSWMCAQAAIENNCLYLV